MAPAHGGPPTILLLQIRDHAGAEAHEQACFAACVGPGRARFRHHNLVASPEVGAADLAAADVVVIGGAGAHSVTETYPFTAPLAGLVRELVAARRPLFGSCWGHQFIAWALGGQVATDPARSEVGTFEIELTDAGERDPIFAGLPRRFAAQLGHNDRVVELPAGAVALARSARCPNQAFRIGELPIWGAQFHVELDERTTAERAAIYRADYVPDEAAFRAFADALCPSPHASTLLRRFLDSLGL